MKNLTPALLTLVLLSLPGPSLQAAPRGLAPGEATTLMVRAMQHQPEVSRTDLTAPIMGRVRAPENDVQRFLLAEAHFINFDPEQARDGFWSFRERSDDFGRVALQRLAIIRINAFEMTQAVLEQDLPEYRRRFPVSPHDRFGISYPLMQAALLLVREGEADRALDLVAEEVRRHHRFDSPYYAYLLPARFLGIAREHGRGDEFSELLQWVREGIDAALHRRLGETGLAGPSEAPVLPGATLGTLFEDRLKDGPEWTAEFIRLRDRLAQDSEA